MKIMLATDGSEASLHAAHRAVAIFGARDSAHEWMIVTARERVETDATGFAGPTETPEDLVLRAEEEFVEANEALTRTTAAAGLAGTRTAVIEGDPAGQVCRLAQERGADVLVVGAHQRTLLDRLFGRSVSRAVLGCAPCPVLVVPEPDHR